MAKGSFLDLLSLNYRTFELIRMGIHFAFLICHILKQSVLPPHLDLGHRKPCCAIPGITIWVSAL